MKLLLIILSLLLSSIYGQTRVSGEIEKDIRWVQDEGPYIVEGDIIVQPRARLFISPGTKIIIAKTNKTPTSDPFDQMDSSLISIRIKGALSCVGRRDKPITFISEDPQFQNFDWRGIILDGAADQFTEIAFVEISGATTAITARYCGAIVRNSIIENNNIGVYCMNGGSLRIYNNIVTRNFTAGIKAESSNPSIFNNIIVQNRNIGLWCDGVSKTTVEYNCFSGNNDGNFLNCDPELGIISEVNKNKDSTDKAYNLFSDPIFSGSPAERKAIELDPNTPTKKSEIIDTALAKVIYDTLSDTVTAQQYRSASHRYSLSEYSPCINAGNPGSKFENEDGSKNTMGIQGGPEFSSD